MALNFPPPNQSPYYDSISGLKYIYNTSIGAWETAIQPPAVVRDTAPDINIDGFLWWDSDAGADGGRLKVKYNSVWVDATPIPDTTASVDISPTAPATPLAGDLWWSDVNGRLYIYYTDANSSQWVDAAPESRKGGSSGEGGVTSVTVSTVAPSSVVEGDLWFNSGNGNLYVRYFDPDSGNGLWITTSGGSSSSGGLLSFAASGALAVAGTLTDPTISIRDSSVTQTGVVKLANTTEAQAGTSTTIALSPAILKNNISSYLTAASSTASGIVELATNAEVAAGSDTTKAITPAGLVASLPSLGLSNPVGTVIEFAKTAAPTGYVKCDGTLVNRTTYANLFAVIGTTFGGGNGATTFALPTLAHTNSLLIYCIKS
jgi:hypothetical protein